EEEISGKNGIQSLLPLLPRIDCGLVGEPTQLQLAVAEKGLLVLDCQARGQAGHAAREEGTNAIYAALRDIEWFRTFTFPKNSPWLGVVKMTVTVIETANQAHNVVPDACRFVVDVRQTDAYTPEEILEVIRQQVRCSVQPRSLRLRATAISLEHPLVQAGLQLGKTPFGSPTSSDKALMGFPALKMGPGDSARSHTADEFIYFDEIREGVETYIGLLQNVLEDAQLNPSKLLLNPSKPTL
ncbi:MAG: M20/M25/M40 family metallo-hydrolase, partial [Saprospiraceae bacterium]